MEYQKKPTAQAPAEPVKYSKISGPAETAEIFKKMYLALKKGVTANDIIVNFQYTNAETEIEFFGEDFKLKIQLSEL